MKKILTGLAILLIVSLFIFGKRIVTNIFPSDGNTGIGTTIPSEKLSVIGGAQSFTATNGTELYTTSNALHKLQFETVETGSVSGAYFMQVSPDLTGTFDDIDYGTNRLKAVNKGAFIDGATNADTAMQNRFGIWFQSNATGSQTIIGNRNPDNYHSLQATRARFYNIQVDSGASASTNGYVLTQIDNNGNLGLQPASSSSGSSGSFTPSLMYVTNINSASINQAYYTKQGSYVHVMVGGIVQTTSIGISTLRINLPFITSNGNQPYIGTGVIQPNAGTQSYVGGILAITSTSTIDLEFYSPINTSSPFSCEFDYKQ